MSRQDTDPHEKHRRNSLDPSRLPAKFKDLINDKLPPAVVMAMMAGCHEMDFLMAAELLLDMTLRSLPMQEANAMAAWQRTREARLHLSAFNDTMEEIEEHKKAPPVRAATAEESAALQLAQKRKR